MKITSVETITPDLSLSRPFVFVQLRTDSGVVGLGQTADVRTAECVHDLGRAFLLGADPLRSTALWHQMFESVAYHGYAGAECRALSAIDIALWDIRGQVYGQPIVDLLGCAVQQQVPIYNTCGTYRDRSDGRRAKEDPVGLAAELLDAGIDCMKWAPFDAYARASSGQRISPAQLAEGISGIVKVADAFGDRMEVMIDAHALWAPVCAGEIVRALDGLPVRWLEDPLPQDNAAEWARLREKSPVPIAGGERLLTGHQVHPLLAAGGVDVLISDVTWCGGITETRRIADLADLYGVPIATHDNSGPVNLWASAHILTAVRNAYAAETVRAYMDPPGGYYDEVVEGAPILSRGVLEAPVEPGLGIRLRENISTVESRTSTG